MPKGVVAALCILCTAAIAGADAGWFGRSGVPARGPMTQSAMLYQGDLDPEFGIGCSTGGGATGGPNAVAVCVTAAITPPFNITSHFYNLYTQVSPNITALSFVCWRGTVAPGAEAGRQAGIPWTQGSHTVAISPPITVSERRFFFGQDQPQTDVGLRWGVDSGSSAGKSFIRASACGVSQFVTLDSIGFPGNWCMAVSVGGTTPTELQSWGSIKARFR